MHTNQTINRLTAKLQKLRAGSCPTFGAGPPFGHGYEVHPITQRELEAKEAELGIRLPDEYRSWLLAVGHGAGPDYGLFPLEKLYPPPYYEQQAFGGEVTRAAEITYEHIARIQQKWDATRANCALSISVDSDEGILIFSESGCAAYTCMLTEGPLRGKIFGLSSEVFRPESALCGLFPEGAYHHFEENGEHRVAITPHKLFGFFDWYENWLDRALTGRWRRFDNPPTAK